MFKIHKDCGGRIGKYRHKEYTYTRCSSCGMHIHHPGDIVETEEKKKYHIAASNKSLNSEKNYHSYVRYGMRTLNIRKV